MLQRFLPHLRSRAAQVDGDVVDAAADAQFPLRVAAIDIGSNAMRFLAAVFLQPNSYTVVEQVRTPVRLGHDVFLTGRLAPEAVDATIEAMKSYRVRMDELGISRYRAVATSAVRDSSNGHELVACVEEAASIRIETITGAEEARLVHQAVKNRIPLGKKRWISVDLGGGSVEVSLVDEEGVRWSVSHGMGSVRLLEELQVAGDEPGRFRRRLEEYAATLRLPASARKAAGFIATGGNIETLAKLRGSEDANGVGRLELGKLREIIEELARLSYRQRVDDLGLREDRADVILPAAMVYERLCILAGFDEILVPNVGVKDGIVLDLVDDVVRHGSHVERLDQTVLGGAVALGKRYRYDDAHAQHVTMLSLSLFDQLEELHGLGEADRRLLLAAAILHDIGAFIAYRKHHKHSLYIIAQSELPGLTPDEILLVANVARYHRKGGPADHHEFFTRLSGPERERVARLASILRMADALDREHMQRVEDVTVVVDDDTVTLEPQGPGDFLLERWALQKKVNLFEKTFEREVKFGDV